MYLLHLNYYVLVAGISLTLCLSSYSGILGFMCNMKLYLKCLEINYTSWWVAQEICLIKYLLVQGICGLNGGMLEGDFCNLL